jgi:hypothetical protein
MTPSTTPIACTLSPDDFRKRMAWIAELNRTALRHHRRDGRRLVLTYAPGAADRVREMARREQACCAFLTFTLREDESEVRLTMEAPREAGESVSVLFEPFIAPETASLPTASERTLRGE